MSKKNKSTVTEYERQALLDAGLALDETCQRVLRILLEDRTLRFSELQNAITKLYDQKLTNKVLSKHLKHLMNKNLAKQTKQDQTVSYSLSDKFRAVTQMSPETLKEYLKQSDEVLPVEFRAKWFDEKEYYSKLSDEELDYETDHDLHDILSLNLWELKGVVETDLALGEDESDDAFWTYFANPTYRMREKRTAKKCRWNQAYKEILFNKINLLTDALRNDRELLRKRRATGKITRA